MIARLLDRLGYVVHEERLPLGLKDVPEACVFSHDAFARARDREEPGEPHVKCYVLMSTHVFLGTPSQGYRLP